MQLWRSHFPFPRNCEEQRAGQGEEAVRSWVGEGEEPKTYQLPGPTGGSAGKESACNAGDWVQSLGQEDPLEEGMGTHSSILAWRIPDRGAWLLQSLGLQSRPRLSNGAHNPLGHPGSCVESWCRRGPGAELQVAWSDLCPLNDQQLPFFTSSIW